MRRAVFRDGDLACDGFSAAEHRRGFHCPRTPSAARFSGARRWERLARILRFSVPSPGRFSPRLRALRRLSAISAALRSLHDCGVYDVNSTDKRLFRRFVRGATAGERRVRRVCRLRAAGKDRECDNIFSGVTKRTTKINFRKNILFFLLLRGAPRFKPFNVLLIIINQLLAPYGRTYNFCVLLSMRARLRTRCGHRREVL